MPSGVALWQRWRRCLRRRRVVRRRLSQQHLSLRGMGSAASTRSKKTVASGQGSAGKALIDPPAIPHKAEDEVRCSHSEPFEGGDRLRAIGMRLISSAIH
eukprot:6198409-Pleurochrysis_carterae.AAC.1